MRTLEQMEARANANLGPWTLCVVSRGENSPGHSPIYDDGEPVMFARLSDLFRAAWQLIPSILGMIETMERLSARQGINPIGWRWWLAIHSDRMEEPVTFWALDPEEGVSDQRPEPANDND